MRYTVLFLVVTLFLVGCNLTDTGEQKGVEAETRTLSLSIPFSPNSKFAQVAQKAIIVVSLDSTVVMEKELTITDSTVEGSVDNLLAGSEYTFTLSVLNSENVTVYKGTAKADIVANEVIEVKIELKAATGSAKIIGTIIDGDDGSAVIFKGESYVRETFVTGRKEGSGGSWMNSNYGASSWMHVGYYDNGSHMKGLIAFNLSAEEAANIKSAKIQLTTDLWQDKHISAPVSIVVYPMDSNWVEGTGGVSTYSGLGEGTANSSTINGATALESSYGENWATEFIGNGTDAGTEIIATSVAHSASEGRVVWEFDITSACSAYQLAKGYLLVMKDMPEQSGTYYDYPKIVTSEHPKAAVDGPRLVVEYAE